MCHDTIGLYRDKRRLAVGCVCRDMPGDTALGRAAWLVRARRAGARRVGARGDIAGPSLRHGRARPTTRPGQAYDTTQCARRLGHGCAPGAPNQFWTQCTVSESLYRTLFINTVHEHCS